MCWKFWFPVLANGKIYIHSSAMLRSQMAEEKSRWRSHPFCSRHQQQYQRKKRETERKQHSAFYLAFTEQEWNICLGRLAAGFCSCRAAVQVSAPFCFVCYSKQNKIDFSVNKRGVRFLIIVAWHVMDGRTFNHGSSRCKYTRHLPRRLGRQLSFGKFSRLLEDNVCVATNEHPLWPVSCTRQQ